MNLKEMSLDELFLEARRAMKSERTEAFKAKEKRRKMDPVVEAVEPTTVYSNPENWTRTRGLAIVRREDKALIGNFWEWRHRTVKDARRLVRSSEPILVEGVEEMSFPLDGTQDAPPAHHATSERLVEAVLELTTPAVTSALVSVRVEYYEQWTSKVLLTQETSFSGGGEILLLPSDIDILPVLARSTKQVLRHPSLLSAI